MTTGRGKVSGGLTPIPTVFLDNLERAVAIIQAEVVEIKPQLKTSCAEVIRLQEQMRLSEQQLKEIRQDMQGHLRESDHPGCLQEKSFVSLQEEQRVLIQKTTSSEANLSTISSEIVAIKGASARFVYWLAGAALVVIGAAVGWIVTLNVLKTEVAYLKVQQQDIQDRIASATGTARASDRNVENTLVRVEAAIKNSVPDQQLYDLASHTPVPRVLPELRIIGEALPEPKQGHAEKHPRSENAAASPLVE